MAVPLVCEVTHLSARLDFDEELTCITKGSEANLKGSTLKLCILWQQEALVQPHNNLAKNKNKTKNEEHQPSPVQKI